MGDVVSLAGVLLTVICVLFIAYYCSRFLGKSWARNSSGGGLKIVGQLQVGADRQILLLRLGERNFLIGVSAAGIQMLAEIEGEFPEETAGQEESVPNGFQELIKKYASLQEKKKGKTDE